MNKIDSGAARALALALSVFASSCTITVDEHSLLHPVRTAPVQPSRFATLPYQVQTLSIPARDHTRLGGVLLTRTKAHAFVVYFGGNLFTIERYGPKIAEALAPLGVNLLLVDHRGYGTSAGQPALAVLQADAVDIVDAARRLRPSDKLVIHGQSLGSFLAGHAATARTVDGVVLESSATTTEDWVAAQLGPTQRRLTRVIIDPSLSGQGNLSNVAAIRAPTLFLVGADDTTTPPSLSQELYAASPLPSGIKRLVVVPRAGHDNVLEQPTALREYNLFLRAVLVAP